MKAPLALGFSALLMVSTMLADYRDERDDRDHRRNDDRRRDSGRVLVYQHANFGGDVLVLYPGDAIENMSGQTFENGGKLNDSISSVRIEGNVELYAYENARYRGEALRLTESARDLSGRPVQGSISVTWNDRISSLRVERLGGRDRGPGRPGDGGPRGDPDKIIKGAFNDLLGREPSSGELREFRLRLIDQGWNERMLRDHLRTEDHFRNEAADVIVRRAYRDVLGRDPDESGFRTYRRNLLDRNWTESDVRDDLRKSAEFRNKPRG